MEEDRLFFLIIKEKNTTIPCSKQMWTNKTKLIKFRDFVRIMANAPHTIQWKHMQIPNVLWWHFRNKFLFLQCIRNEAIILWSLTMWQWQPLLFKTEEWLPHTPPLGGHTSWKQCWSMKCHPACITWWLSVQVAHKTWWSDGHKEKNHYKHHKEGHIFPHSPSSHES